MSGQLTKINLALLEDPSAINVNTYDAGWLFEITGEGDSLLSPNDYLKHLAAVWQVTQQTIKGQMNE